MYAFISVKTEVYFRRLQVFNNATFMLWTWMIIFNHAAYLAQVCYYIGLIAIINKLLQVIFEIVTLIFTVKPDGSYLF